MRLDKFLANQGVGSRKQVKDLLKQGVITVNGAVVNRPESKVNPEIDVIALEGIPFQYMAFYYIMMYKPAGCVCAANDNINHTVLDLLAFEDRRKDLFPVGRLDKDTEGLLLLTNDGQLAHALLSPRKHVDKMYYVELRKPLLDGNITAFAKGMDIGDDVLTLPARLEVLECSADNLHCMAAAASAQVTIHEGRFHQIKRMFHALDNEVLYLKRLSMGSLILDETLKPGEYRRLTDKELLELRPNEHRKD